MNPTLLILAAGMGSRYGGLKQLDKFGPSGETLMDYSVYDAIQAGFDKVVFVIRKDFEEAFKEQFIDKLAQKVKVEYVFQEILIQMEGVAGLEERKKPWGTGHAIMAAKDVIDSPFAVINADDFYGKTAYTGMADYLKNLDNSQKGKYALMAYILKNTVSAHGSVSRGVCQVNVDNHLTEIIERKKIFLENDTIYYPDPEGNKQEMQGSELVSMNFWGFTPDLFETLDNRFPEFVKANQEDPKAEFLIPEEVQIMIANQEATVDVLTSDAHWIGVTYQEDKPAAIQSLQNLVDQGHYPGALWG